MKITFFGTQPYDRESFDRANASCGFEFNYHRSHLNGNNALLAQGADAVCIFVNDTADAGTIRQLAAMGVKLIALRCAGAQPQSPPCLLAHARRQLLAARPDGVRHVRQDGGHHRHRQDRP